MPLKSTPEASIDDLMTKAATPPGYWKDLRRIVELEKEGLARPTYLELRDFFQKKFGVDFHWSTIRNHYDQVKNGR